MKLTKDNADCEYTISGYDDESVTVNDQKLKHSFLIHPDHLMTVWPVDHISAIVETKLTAVFSLVADPALLILGTGNTLVFPDQALFQPFYTKHIGVEVMDTKAACRTYQILTAEGRNIVCAMIIESSSIYSFSEKAF